MDFFLEFRESTDREHENELEQESETHQKAQEKLITSVSSSKVSGSTIMTTYNMMFDNFLLSPREFSGILLNCFRPYQAKQKKDVRSAGQQDKIIIIIINI